MLMHSPVFVLSLVLLLLSCPFLSAYRIGDVVDTVRKADESKSNTETEDCFRNQMPKFGQDTSVEFPDSARGYKRFTLAFEEGLRPLPWVYMKDSLGYPLVALTIEFHFSRHQGIIHAISSSPNYGQRPRQKSRSFFVQYKWVEEAYVDPKSALAMTYLLTIVSCLVILMGSCCSGSPSKKDALDEKVHGMSSSEGYGDAYATNNYLQQPSGVPKWD